MTGPLARTRLRTPCDFLHARRSRPGRGAGKQSIMENFPTLERTIGPRLLLLHPTDNILVCATRVSAGDRLTIDGAALVAPEAVEVGHKVARRALASGEKVIKYGAPIGSATAAIPIGAWVHSHNMKSDYLASHTRETASGRAGK